MCEVLINNIYHWNNTETRCSQVCSCRLQAGSMRASGPARWLTKVSQLLRSRLPWWRSELKMKDCQHVVVLWRRWPTLYVGLSVHKAHAGELVQLTGKPLLWRLVRVAGPHLAHHLTHELIEDLLVAGRGGWAGLGRGGDRGDQVGREAGQAQALEHIRGGRPQSLHALLDLHDGLQGEWKV